MGAGESKTPSQSSVSLSNLSGSGSQGLGSVPQSLPKVRTPWVLPGGTTARLRLWCCTKNTQEMPAGTLRKVSGSVPSCTAWMVAAPKVRNLDALANCGPADKTEAGKAGASSAGFPDSVPCPGALCVEKL